MPEQANAPLGLAILYLIRQVESQAVQTARTLLARSQQEIADAALRASLVELIETVLLYKLSHLSRQEIQAMLELPDLRQSRLYQEIKEEGKEEGMAAERQRFLEEKLSSIPKLAALAIPAEVIADVLHLDVDLVRKEMTKKPSS